MSSTPLWDLEGLRDWVVVEGVTHVAIEATGVFWKPVWFVLEEADFELLLANSRSMRMVPGRKTDVADAGVDRAATGGRVCCAGAMSRRH